MHLSSMHFVRAVLLKKEYKEREREREREREGEGEGGRERD